MDVNFTGVWLLLITLGLVAITIVAYPFIKKITNLYWFWMPISILLLIYMIYFRFFQDFSDFWKMKDKTGIVASKALLLDLCPFCAFMIPIFLIIDPTRKIASVLAFFAIFGGLVTYIGGFCINSGGTTVDAKWDWHWILIGDEPNSMYFMIHFILLFFGPLIILNTKRTFWKDACSGICFILLYFGYVLIMVHTFSVTNNATGLVPGDWNEWGEYGAVDNLLHLSFPYIVPVAFGLVTLFILLVMYLYGLLQKNKQYIYNYSNKNLFIL